MDHMMTMASERVCYVHCNFCNTILAVSVPCSSMYAAAVTVRCGHCSTLLSVNMAAAAAAAASNTFQFSPQQPDHLLHQLQKQHEQQQASSAGLLEGPPGYQQRGITRKSSDINVISLSSSSTISKSSTTSSSSSPNSTSNNVKINPNVSAAAAASFATLNHHRLQYSSEQYHHEPPRTPPIRPPEKRQRVPSAYNKFIKEEIQRIKASNPEISHREAFSLAAKNWAHFPRIHFGLNLESQAIPAVEGTQQKSPGFY